MRSERPRRCCAAEKRDKLPPFQPIRIASAAPSQGESIADWRVPSQRDFHAVYVSLGSSASKATEALRPCNSAGPPKADVNSPPWLPPLSANSGLMHCKSLHQFHLPNLHTMQMILSPIIASLALG